MEHPISDIHQYVEKMNSISKSMPTGQRLHLAGVKRVEELEVDIKALSRMNKAGYNPYEAEEFFSALEEKFGNRISPSHPMWSTRRTAISAALSASGKVLGKPFDKNRPVKTDMVKPVRALVSSSGFREQRLQLARQIVEVKPSDFDAKINDILTSSPLVEDRLKHDKVLINKIYSTSHRLSGAVGDLVSDSEKMDLEMRIRSSGYNSFQTSYTNHINKTGLIPKNTDHVAVVLESSKMYVPLPIHIDPEYGPNNSHIHEVLHKKNELSAELNKIISSTKIEDQSRVKAIKKELQYVEGSIENLKSMFTPGQTRDEIFHQLELLAKNPGYETPSKEWVNLEENLLKISKYNAWSKYQAIQTQLNNSIINWYPKLKIGSDLDEATNVIRKVTSLVSPSELEKNIPHIAANISASAIEKLKNPANVKDQRAIFEESSRMIADLTRNFSEKSQNYPKIVQTSAREISKIQREFQNSAINMSDLIYSRPKIDLNSKKINVYSEYLIIPPDEAKHFYTPENNANFAKKIIAEFNSRINTVNSVKDLFDEVDKTMSSFKEFYNRSSLQAGLNPKDIKQSLSDIEKVVTGKIRSIQFSDLPEHLGNTRARSLFILKYPNVAKTTGTLNFGSATATRLDLENNILKNPSKYTGIANKLTLHEVESVYKVAGVPIAKHLPDMAPFLGGDGSVSLPSKEQGKLITNLIASADPHNSKEVELAAKLYRGLRNAGDSEIDKTEISEAYKKIDDLKKNFLIRTFNEQSPSLPLKQKVANSIEKWGKTFGSDLLSYDWLNNNGNSVMSKLMSKPTDVFDVVEGYIEGSKAAIAYELKNHTTSKATRERLSENFEQKPSGLLGDKIEDFEKAVFRNDKFAEDLISKTPPSRVAQYLKATTPYYKSMSHFGAYDGIHRDLMVEKVLDSIHEHPELALNLKDENLVGQLLLSNNRQRLAMVQLEDKLDLRAEAERIKNPRTQVPGHEVVRQKIKDAKETIEKQFPQKTVERSKIIEEVEQRLQSTQAESQYLRSSRIHQDNWFEAKEVVGVDFPRMLSEEMKSDFDKLEAIKYVSGRQPTYPAFIENQRNPDWGRQQIDTVKKMYFQSDRFGRAFSIQGFLDEKSGILSDKRMADEVTKTVLGDLKNNDLVRELFDSYFSSVPASEKKLILSYIFSTFPETGMGKGVPLKTILEGMGPLGVRAGQYLRSSGRLSKELNTQLDHFFENALPPLRPNVFERLENVFGKSLGPVTGVRETVGSGSLNYGVGVEIGDEHAVMRFHRRESEGQVETENRNWKATTEKLAMSSNAEVRRMGSTLEESRMAAMESLGAGGHEYDLSKEREAYSRAKAAYETGVNPETGYKIEVLKVNQKLQDLIPPEQVKTASAYERIFNSKFNQLSPEMKAKISKQITTAEMKAMFEKGTFDPDGHIGNWLIDEKNKRLVRIDYAQLRSVPKSDLNNIKKVLGVLFVPNLSDGDFNLIAKNKELLFDMPKNLKPSNKEIVSYLKEIVGSNDFPNSFEPQQRLLEIRNGLEKKLSNALGSEIRIQLKSDTRAVIASIGRLFYYRDHIPEQEFGKIAAKHMDLPVKKIYLQTKTMEIKASASKYLDNIKDRLGKSPKKDNVKIESRQISKDTIQNGKIVESRRDQLIRGIKKKLNIGGGICEK